MADKPGDKRAAGEDIQDKEKRPGKIRRFDMKTPVARDRASHSKKRTSADRRSSSENDKSGSQLSAKPSLTDSEKMEVNAMLQQSMELQKAAISGIKGSSSSSSCGSNADCKPPSSDIVDRLFQDYMAHKLSYSIDQTSSSEGPLSAMLNQILDAEITAIQSNSVVSSLYNDSDEDVKAGAAYQDSSDENLASDYGTDSEQKASMINDDSDNTAWAQNAAAGDSVPVPSAAPAQAQGVDSPAEELALPKRQSLADTEDDPVPVVLPKVEPAAKGIKFVFGKKPLEGVKKIGLSIGQESLARITGNWKNGKILEDGEVASSSDTEAESKSKVESDDDDKYSFVSETGSLSDTGSKEDFYGKEKAKKKRSKHRHKDKHRHKKKKKHKNKEKEDEKEKRADSRDKGKEGEKEKQVDSRDLGKEGETETEKGEKGNDKGETEHEKEGEKDTKEKATEGLEKTEEKDVKDGEHKDSKEPKDRKKRKQRSRSRSKSRHKASRSKSKRSKSRSRSRSQDKRSPGKFDPWDARNYGPDGPISPRSSSGHHKHKTRSRNSSKERSDRSRHGSSDKDRHKKRSRSRDRSRDKDRKKDPKDSNKEKEVTDADMRVHIDKAKLRKIAIARALANMEKGQGPAVDLTAVKSGGKSVQELTEFCKRISEKDQGHGVSDSDSSGSYASDPEEVPLHHPFKLRDPATLPNIIMNIRNAKQLPVLTPQEKQTQAAQLRTQFPVSSGTQHRAKESEWVPVTPTAIATTATKGKVVAATAPAVVASAAVASAGTVPAALPPGPLAIMPPAPASAESVFPEPQPNLDIGNIVAERLQAMRRLEENPFDIQALSSVHKMNEQANAWAQSKQLPGQFTGTTDVRILSQQELAGPNKKHQAWAKKDQFRKAPPLQGGIGMFLLQKMGWKPGDGLGKDNEGSKLPLLLDVKMDRKGLSTSSEVQRPVPMMAPMNRPRPPAPRAKDLSGKHPVSALTELCCKRKWGIPVFDLVSEVGPPHKRMFLFKVRVNGVEYIPAAACSNKKLAKAQAAAVCLQEMGLIPRDFVVTV